MNQSSNNPSILTRPTHPFGLGVLTLLFYLFINSSLTIHRWLLGDGWWFSLVPTVESLFLMVGLFLVIRLGRRIKVVGLVILGLGYGSLVIFSTAEYVVQLIYGRPFLPQVDIPMIRGVVLLLFGQIGPLADILTPLVQGLILVVTWTLSFGMVVLASKIVSQLPRTYWFPGSFSLTLLMLMIVFQPVTILSGMVLERVGSGGPVSFQDVLSGNRTLIQGSLTSLNSDQSNTLTNHDNPRALDQNQVPDIPSYIFPGIMDRDIYVFALEAYGYAAHSREDLFTLLEPEFLRFQEVLQGAGYGLVSNYLLSPVAGGFSWLAEASFLTGQWINSQPVFLQLYEQPVSTLPGFLYDGGYYTFTVKPGTVHGSWPEGWDLFRFREAMVAYDGDFNFRGPWFSYVPITDQFAIYAAHQRILELRSPGGPAEHRPLFAHYQLVSSHTPFNKIPPYLEDWEDLGDGSIYHQLADQTLTFDNTWTGGTQLDEGFVAAQSYVFTVLSEYIDRFLDHERNPIIIILGDHQPQRPIREQNAHLSVPIHIASRDPEILQRFMASGFSPGFRGSQSPPHLPMSEFFPLLVNLAFQSSVGEEATVDFLE